MWLLNATDRLARMIPRSTMIELDGIGHSALVRTRRNRWPVF